MTTMTESTHEQTRQWVERLINAKRIAGHTLESACYVLARELGCQPGTLKNIWRKRLKRVEAALFIRLSQMIVEATAAELRRIHEELDVHRINPSLVSQDLVRQLSAQVLELDEIVKKGKKQ